LERFIEGPSSRRLLAGIVPCNGDPRPTARRRSAAFEQRGFFHADTKTSAQCRGRNGPIMAARILVVDDEKLIRWGPAQALEQIG
jgi:hypothetical protein